MRVNPTSPSPAGPTTSLGLALLLCAACASPDAGSGSGSGESGETGATSAESESGEAGESAESEAGETSSTTGGDGDTTEGGDGDGDAGPSPSDLPTPTGTCPTLASGTVMISPAGVTPRPVTVWVSDAAQSLDGPLVFYWHAYTSQPQEAVYGLSQGVIDEILAQGGMVIAPSSDPAAGQFPWFQLGGTGLEYDQQVADEVVACAIEQVGIDTRHIHSVGMSAGGLQTSQFSTRRSNYVASAATYSGGVFFDAPYTDPGNRFPAMIIHGGDSDVFGGQVNFKTTSQNWFNQLTGNGNFAFMCDHGGGHNIPPDTGDDIWRFFQDHPYGEPDSPYAAGLPGGFPSWCSL